MCGMGKFTALPRFFLAKKQKVGKTADFLRKDSGISCGNAENHIEMREKWEYNDKL